MKYTTKQTKFINHIKTVSKIYGIKCSLRNSTFVKADRGIPCAGWFEDKNNLLVVAMKAKDWSEVLVHEYAHITQYVENNIIYQKGNIGCIKMDQWLSGKSVKNINQYMDAVREMELDNEKRSVNLIKTFQLDINVDNYIRKANAYIHYYNWLKETRKWCSPKNYPYNNKRLLSKMSNKFNMDYKKLTPELRLIFKEENI